MNAEAKMKALGIAASVNVAGLLLGLLGGNSCGRGDGCLFYSAAFFIGVLTALLILCASTVLWIKKRRTAAESGFFLYSNAALLLLVLGMTTAVVVEVLRHT
jgi:hypothetical protein